MKKLEFEKGAITPFWTKDLEYMQKGFEEVLKVIIEGLSLKKTNFIISGCKITYTENKVSMTSGWAYYNGEILPVKALVETDYSSGRYPTIYFVKRTEYDESGSRIILKENESVTANIYKIDYLSSSATTPASFNTNNGFSITPKTLDLEAIITNRNKIADTGLVGASVDSSVTSTLKYRQIGGVVQFYGSIYSDRYSGDIVSYLPNPIADITLNINNVLVTIKTDGKMSVSYLDKTIDLSGITYLSDPIFYLTDN